MMADLNSISVMSRLTGVITDTFKYDQLGGSFEKESFTAFGRIIVVYVL